MPKTHTFSEYSGDISSGSSRSSSRRIDLRKRPKVQPRFSEVFTASDVSGPESTHQKSLTLKSTLLSSDSDDGKHINLFQQRPKKTKIDWESSRNDSTIATSPVVVLDPLNKQAHSTMINPNLSVRIPDMDMSSISSLKQIEAHPNLSDKSRRTSKRVTQSEIQPMVTPRKSPRTTTNQPSSKEKSASSSIPVKRNLRNPPEQSNLIRKSPRNISATDNSHKVITPQQRQTSSGNSKINESKTDLELNSPSPANDSKTASSVRSTPKGAPNAQIRKHRISSPALVSKNSNSARVLNESREGSSHSILSSKNVKNTSIRNSKTSDQENLISKYKKKSSLDVMEYSNAAKTSSSYSQQNLEEPSEKIDSIDAKAVNQDKPVNESIPQIVNESLTPTQVRQRSSNKSSNTTQKSETSKRRSRSNIGKDTTEEATPEAHPKGKTVESTQKKSKNKITITKGSTDISSGSSRTSSTQKHGLRKRPKVDHRFSEVLVSSDGSGSVSTHKKSPVLQSALLSSDSDDGRHINLLQQRPKKTKIDSESSRNDLTIATSSVVVLDPLKKQAYSTMINPNLSVRIPNMDMSSISSLKQIEADPNLSDKSRRTSKREAQSEIQPIVTPRQSPRTITNQTSSKEKSANTSIRGKRNLRSSPEESQSIPKLPKNNSATNNSHNAITPQQRRISSRNSKINESKADPELNSPNPANDSKTASSVRSTPKGAPNVRTRKHRISSPAPVSKKSNSARTLLELGEGSSHLSLSSKNVKNTSIRNSKISDQENLISKHKKNTSLSVPENSNAAETSSSYSQPNPEKTNEKIHFIDAKALNQDKSVKESIPKIINESLTPTQVRQIFSNKSSDTTQKSETSKRRDRPNIEKDTVEETTPEAHPKRNTVELTEKTSKNKTTISKDISKVREDLSPVPASKRISVGRHQDISVSMQDKTNKIQDTGKQNLEQSQTKNIGRNFKKNATQTRITQHRKKSKTLDIKQLLEKLQMDYHKKKEDLELKLSQKTMPIESSFIEKKKSANKTITTNLDLTKIKPKPNKGKMPEADVMYKGKRLPNKAVFLRPAWYFNKPFHQFLQNHMTQRYGEEDSVTKSNELIQIIHTFVKNVESSAHYNENEVEAFKRVIADTGIVRTHFEFHNFVRDWLPDQTFTKVVPYLIPITKKCSIPNWDKRLAFQPII